MALKLTVVLLILQYISACEYEQFGSDHTMCRYPTTTCAIKVRGFTEHEKQEITRAHNEMRQKVALGNQEGQPTASNMMELGWNDELAEIAQKWADQCVFNHDQNRRTSTYSYVGQNIYQFWSTSSSSKTNVRDAVIAWYDEVNNPGFSSKFISPFQYVHDAGHYTQIVWAETRAVGCGLVRSRKNFMYVMLIVCNYGPGGNIIQGEMYSPGKPCSNCPSGCSEAYDGLCRGRSDGIYKKIANKNAESIPSDKKKEAITVHIPIEKMFPAESAYKKLFEFFPSSEDIERKQRPIRQSEDSENTSFIQRAFDFFFGPCENEKNFY